MSRAGWYPDPGGQPGKFRYWTGTSWSASITDNPNQAAPTGGIGATPPSWSSYPGGYQTQQPKRRSALGWWIGIGVVVVAVIVAVTLVIQNLGNVFGGQPTPGSNPTQGVCPKDVRTTASPAADPNDGRVHGGALSYPRLGSPWGAPEIETRVPFGRDVLVQSVTIEPDYNGKGSSWVASVLVGELVAGDGFFSPEQGSEIVVKCIMGVFYGDAEVTRADKVNKASTVDGKDAWLVETQLSFDIPGLKAKGELAIILIVATSAESSSIYYASIPDNAPSQLTTDARRAMSQLRVG